VIAFDAISTTEPASDRIIRPARLSEAASLSDLALRSKGYRPYDAAFLEACRAELTLTSSYIETHEVCVCERQGRIVGFYALDEKPPGGELDYLFVEPDAIGHGYGKRLLLHAVETARRRGWSYLIIEADPYAEPFYLAMGAIRIGVVPSGSIPGRVIPLCRLALMEEHATTLHD
jgi:GNAT superfamily N-acetyltransferase